MGIAGLWEILHPAGRVRSLTHLAVVDGFDRNLDGLRGFRLGIDASIWFFHAAYGKEGENPELRTLFFRCAMLMRAPFLPLFVFDGPMRPSVKRGKRISGNAHWLTTGMKNIIDAFGFEWRTAPGEAEAELAYLNQIGAIDGILSDDVDTFLFGASLVIRNSGNMLSGNKAHPVKNFSGKDDKNHTFVYSSKDIAEHSEIRLTRGGLILVGLLSGGDYDQAGLARCGIKIAHSLTKCGFGESLFQAATSLPRRELPGFLSEWRSELRRELLTDSQGQLGKKHVALANSVPDDFPDIDILLSYANPITSGTHGKAAGIPKFAWMKEPSLGRLANICELYFEWGVKETIIKRFRNIIWPSAVIRILRRAALDLDEYHEDFTPLHPVRAEPLTISDSQTPETLAGALASTQPKSSSIARPTSTIPCGKHLIIKIHSTRTHASTDGILEYRLEIAPKILVQHCEAGITGIRPPLELDEWAEEPEGIEDGRRETGKAPPDPTSHFRMWAPACIVQIVQPTLVNDFNAVQEERQRKTCRRTTKAKARSDSPAHLDAHISSTHNSSIHTPPRKKVTARCQKVAIKAVNRKTFVDDSSPPEDNAGNTLSREPAETEHCLYGDALESTSAGKTQKVRKARANIHVGRVRQDIRQIFAVRKGINATQCVETFVDSDSVGLTTPADVSKKTAEPDDCPAVLASRTTAVPYKILQARNGDSSSACEESVAVYSAASKGVESRPLPTIPYRLEHGTPIQDESFLESLSGRSLTSVIAQSHDNASDAESENDLHNDRSASVLGMAVKPLPTTSKQRRIANGEATGNKVSFRSHTDRLSAMPYKALDVIEISSDSDSTTPRRVRHPLVAARAKSNSRPLQPPTMTNPPAKEGRSGSVIDVIDLT